VTALPRCRRWAARWIRSEIGQIGAPRTLPHKCAGLSRRHEMRVVGRQGLARCQRYEARGVGGQHKGRQPSPADIHSFWLGFHRQHSDHMQNDACHHWFGTSNAPSMNVIALHDRFSSMFPDFPSARVGLAEPTTPSNGRLCAVGRGAVPAVSPIVLICISGGAHNPGLRHRRYKRIQFPASLTGRTAL
jgi:hypothetical protein